MTVNKRISFKIVNESSFIIFQCVQVKARSTGTNSQWHHVSDSNICIISIDGARVSMEPTYSAVAVSKKF